ncbi:unnamed protein product [Tuber melanosporum]|uniref:(Perigord truffle) hypothetical protein n=1 Tax=Tuber melanosporum (strain Mel28) TaxID=656061 RepID=D5GHS5_TUBMM|nr:uncharacterized protein GSTUM_00008016001 [Tuber melanosporum]CAZ84036.1 unnamed protein product [Tuber melanosporum]
MNFPGVFRSSEKGAEWTKKYGSIYKLKLGKDTVIVLGTQQAAKDLLEKRSKIYSSRPRTVMAGENVSRGKKLLAHLIGDKWRVHRRLQGQVINQNITNKYKGFQNLESAQLIKELADRPEDFFDSFHRYNSSVIFAMAYGKRMPRGDEEDVVAVDEITQNFLYSARLGTWIVDSFPFLNYLPTSMAPWKRIGDNFYNWAEKMHTFNRNEALQRKGWNWTKEIARMKEAQNVSPLELAFMVGFLYEAGSDSTTIALEVFILALLKHPEVLKRAQEEIDRVVGPDRLPAFEDRDNLPYVRNCVNEVLRWRSPSVGGVPHMVEEDDEYMGYRIPKGAIVVGNLWSIHQDPEVYPNPTKFMPERWDDEENVHYGFGFGRRACPGRHIAINSLFINCARIIWGFNVEHAKNSDGTVIPVDEWDMTQGFMSRPVRYKASITPRDAKRVEVINQAWKAAEVQLQDMSKILRMEDF